ncbi:MAG TPA: hypothetical protein VNU95_00215 [Candidatus Acidoferrales bacterium]|jgi:hypothetical protein|nr:hypothetical protein [Candidatus Acidoferrales bacterium]
MNHHQKRPGVTLRNPAWRHAVETLDEALGQNSEHSNAELIDRMGRHMFGDLWRKHENEELKRYGN